ncbi:MAG: NAD(P)-binding domain-containing protein, partial [Candidatus Binatia bacterium]
PIKLDAPSAVPAAAAAKAAVKGEPKKTAKELVPELSRSAEAKERISKIMKGVSLRPIRRPGTLRQWITVGVIAASLALSFVVPRTWVAAGPVYKGHADFEGQCTTCHLTGPRPSLLAITTFVLPALAMNESCASADCHGNVLNTRPDKRDDCVGCHSDHRGREFPIRGGEKQCWSCHRGRTEPQDYETRLMKISLTDNFELKAKLTERLNPIETGLKFSHQAHDKETAGDKKYDQCTGCHASIDSGRTFALPSHAQCLECHDKAVSADTKVAQQKKGPDCLQCHTREDGEMQKATLSKFAYVKFLHKDHQNEFCKSCHASIWEEGSYQNVKRDPGLYPVAMDACFTCHTQKSATLGCIDCHKLHHSFPPKEAVQVAAVRTGGGFDGMLIGLLVLSLGVIGYVYADMRVAKRFLEPPPPPPPAAGGGGPAPAGGGGAAKEEAAGEIMPFPKVDVEACISCGSCYGSCPKQVLAADDHHKSTVVNPGSCIAQTEGCAVCEQGCPTGAIRVSTAPLKRTVERPEIDEHNEAPKLPGLFFAGEVIGAALIKSAINQGNQDVAYIADKKKGGAAPYDVIVVGAGPAGLGAGLEAKKRNLKFLMLERDTVASTIRNYPRDKAVLAEPIKMPLYGQLPMVDADKDTLIAMWNAVVNTTKLSEHVKEGEEVLDIKKKDNALEVKTNKGTYTAANVILAIGTRGNPRKLGVAGEAAPRVQYNLIDPGEFKGKSVIVVGGGDSAIEAAVALGRVEGCKCVLSYRRNAFARVKKRNQEQIDEMGKAGRVEVLLSSSIEEIRPSSVTMKTEAGVREITADQIFALIGADPPKTWIEKTIGVPFVMREEEVVTW